MQLKHPDLTAGRTVTSSAAAATVEAVEARWQAEHRKERAAQLRKTIVSFFSWVFLLLVIPGAAWYFYGDRVLPPEWTYPQVYGRLMKFIIPESVVEEPKVEEPKTDPADLATAKKRAAMKAAINELETICRMKAPIQAKLGCVDRLKASSAHKLFERIIAADRSYQEVCENLARMNAKNEKLSRQRASESVSKNRAYIAQYSDKDLARQEMRVKDALINCARVRLKSVESAHLAVKRESAKWIGPESCIDAERMLGRLERLYEELRAEESSPKIKKDQPEEVIGNLPLPLQSRE